MRTAAAMLAGFGFAGLAMVPLFLKQMSPVTSGAILGILGTLCVVAIVLAVANVRRSEAKRKAKLQIWMKH